MSHEEQFRAIQRYHDGEATRMEAAGVQQMLTQHPHLQAGSTQLESLHSWLDEHCQRSSTQADEAVVAAVMERLPQRLPMRHAHVSMKHILACLIILVCVLFGCGLTEQMRSFIPVEGIAMISALIGGSILIAARPLTQLEAVVLTRFLRRKISVGDGEVLVCRVFGLALVIGGSHIIGAWG